MDEACEKTANEPCHTQLWTALSRLDEAVLQFQELYRTLAGQDEPPITEGSQKSPSPSFARVLEVAPGRVREAQATLCDLRNDFKKLCLQGLS